MSHKDVEIEIKLRLDDNDFSRVKEKLGMISKFTGTMHQSDQYFIPAHRNFLEPEFPFEWLSIRTRGGKTLLSYKHYHPENCEKTTHCDEFEVEVNSPEKLGKIFSSLDFKSLITVEKERETYIFKDELEIAIDTVDELGRFIEIESIKDFGSVEAAREKIFEFAKNLGLDTSVRYKRGYPRMLMEKKGLVRN